MSNTRHAEPGSPLNQSRYASSPELDRGLLGNMVAKRSTVLKNAEDRELIFFVQYISHSEGGLKQFVRELLETFPHFIATKSMQDFGVKAGKIYTAAQVRKIRAEFPEAHSTTEYMGGEFPLADDLRRFATPMINESHPGWSDLDCEEREKMRRRAREDKERRAKLPTSYAMEVFQNRCREAAKENLERAISEFCTDAAWDLDSARPWYFPNLVTALREYKKEWEKKHSIQVETEIGAKISESLDYCIQTGSLVLVEGNTGIGKAYALKKYCERNPGLIRYVQVPTYADDASFFRAIGRSLGISAALSLKVQQLRDRCEDTLRESNGLALAFDQAQFLFVASTHREIMFRRINWIMCQANSGVPVFLCATPQFLETQKSAETVSKWNSEQLTRGMTYVQLPSVVSKKDLASVAKALAPEMDDDAIKAVVIYADKSSKYIAGIDTVLKRARFISHRKGRDKITGKDVCEAMSESVMPSDRALAEAMSNTAKSGAKNRRPISYTVSEPPASIERLNTPVLTLADSRDKGRINTPITEEVTIL